MVDASDSSFSFIEDSEQGSSFYDTFVENEGLVNFGDNNTEILNEITEISGVVIGNEAAADVRIADARAAEVLAGDEVNSKPVSDIWKFFTRKEKNIKDQSGNEKIEQIIFCNVGNCHLSPNNSTTTLERHLKSRHHNAYIELYEKRIAIEPWSADMQKLNMNFLLTGLLWINNHSILLII